MGSIVQRAKGLYQVGVHVCRGSPVFIISMLVGKGGVGYPQRSMPAFQGPGKGLTQRDFAPILTPVAAVDNHVLIVVGFQALHMPVDLLPSRRRLQNSCAK